MSAAVGTVMVSEALNLLFVKYRKAEIAPRS
jgi:hypothetical protein